MTAQDNLASADPWFFTPDGPGRYQSTAFTLGPWGGNSQHGGPPSALLGREMQRHEPREGADIFRFTAEILRPVPAASLEVRVRTARGGRSIELLEAVMTADDVEVMRASAWRMAPQIDGVDVPVQVPPLPPPTEGTYENFFDIGLERGYHTAMEWRFIEGAFLKAGPARVWLRQQIPLVPDEEPSPLQRVLCVADSGNGVSAVADARELTFVNTDLTVHLRRQPQGEWIGMEAETAMDPNGVGLAESVLHDQDGPIGRGAQILFVAPR